MKNYIKLFLCFTVLLTVRNLFAQTSITEQAKTDLIALSESYKKNNKWRFSSSYQLFADSMPQAVASELSGVTIVNGTSQYQKLGDIESYHTTNYNLIINHAEKTIYFLPVEKKQDSQLSGMVFNDPQGFISTCDSITFTDQKNERQYIFYTQREQYNKITIVFNQKKKQVQSVALKSDSQQSLLKIVYSDFSSKDIPGQEWFSYTRFLELDNNRFKCTPAYESYQLFNKITNTDTIK